MLARAIDTWWDELGRPDPFVVAEAGAGRGALCRAVLEAEPRCAPALRYLLVERSEVLRRLQPSTVAVEPAQDVLGPVAPADEEDEDGALPLPGRGPRVGSLPDLPATPFCGVVLANELLDNLPFSLLERVADGWHEVRVDAGCREVLVPASPDLVAVAPEAAERGARVPVQRGAAAWLRDAVRVVERGRVVAVDYASTTGELSARPWRTWVRTFRHGGPGGGPLDRPGEQDVTCEVCVDQLARVRPLAADRSQAEFLRHHGIDELVAAARAEWRAGAAQGGLDALRARSRVSEAEALLDPSGLGGFRVLEWAVA